MVVGKSRGGPNRERIVDLKELLPQRQEEAEATTKKQSMVVVVAVVVEMFATKQDLHLR